MTLAMGALALGILCDLRADSARTWRSFWRWVALCWWFLCLVLGAADVILFFWGDTQ